MFFLPNFRRIVLEGYLSVPVFLADLSFSTRVLHKSLIIYAGNEGGRGRGEVVVLQFLFFSISCLLELVSHRIMPSAPRFYRVVGLYVRVCVCVGVCVCVRVSKSKAQN